LLSAAGGAATTAGVAGGSATVSVLDGTSIGRADADRLTAAATTGFSAGAGVTGSPWTVVGTGGAEAGAVRSSRTVVRTGAPAKEGTDRGALTAAVAVAVAVAVALAVVVAAVFATGKVATDGFSLGGVVSTSAARGAAVDPDMTEIGFGTAPAAGGSPTFNATISILPFDCTVPKYISNKAPTRSRPMMAVARITSTTERVHWSLPVAGNAGPAP
jgi:hypothetical protein